MPESRTRKKARSSEPPLPPRPGESSNPTWFVPLFCTLLIVGLVWVVITYISDSRFPIPGIYQWNLAVGFALIIAGFIMTMRWK